VVLVAHWPVLTARVLSSDDSEYIGANPVVSNASWASAGRFLSEVLGPSTVAGFYEPLALISLMADSALGGGAENLRPFHRTSLALHLANAVLLFVLLGALFRNRWVSAGAALLFGVHPLTVEPIAWVADRKTLLAAFFSLVSLVLYVRYARRVRPGAYAGSLMAFALALMSKPTSVPLPVLLLLVDYWPLKRQSRRAILEKVPFLLLGVAGAVITIVSQGRTGVLTAPGPEGPGRLVLLVSHNVVFYILKIVWPVKLSSYYPYPEPLSLAHPAVLAGVVGTAFLVALAVVSLRWTCALAAGWSFFFVGLFPTLGVVGFTVVVAADKFVYLPSVGLVMLLAWLLCGAARAAARLRPAVLRFAPAAAVVLVAGAEVVATRRYLGVWQDSIAYHRRVVSLAPAAARPRINLGFALHADGRYAEAEGALREAVRLEPTSAVAHNNLAACLAEQGKLADAVEHYRRAVEAARGPAHIRALCHVNLAQVLGKLGDHDAAVRELRHALRLSPTCTEARRALAGEFAEQERYGDAEAEFREALRVNPRDDVAHNGLGAVLATQGRLPEAIEHFQQALRIAPRFLDAHLNLGKGYASLGRVQSAMEHYRGAIAAALTDTREQKVATAEAHALLASLLLQAGAGQEALEHLRLALALDPGFPEARNSLARMLAGERRFTEAAAVLREGLAHGPDDLGTLNNLAWLLATCPEAGVRDGAEAVRLATRACELTGYRNPLPLASLAAALAETGRFQEAIETAGRAKERALNLGHGELVSVIAAQIRLYEDRRPYREP